MTTENSCTILAMYYSFDLFVSFEIISIDFVILLDVLDLLIVLTLSIVDVFIIVIVVLGEREISTRFCMCSQ